MIWIRQNLLSDNIIDLFDDDPQKACWMAYSKTPVLVIYTIADWKEKDSANQTMLAELCGTHCIQNIQKHSMKMAISELPVRLDHYQPILKIRITLEC